MITRTKLKHYLLFLGQKVCFLRLCVCVNDARRLTQFLQHFGFSLRPSHWSQSSSCRSTTCSGSFHIQARTNNLGAYRRNGEPAYTRLSVCVCVCLLHNSQSNGRGATLQFRTKPRIDNRRGRKKTHGSKSTVQKLRSFEMSKWKLQRTAHLRTHFSRSQPPV